MHDAVNHLQRLLHAAVEACHPSQVVRRALPDRPTGRIIVVGAGKAAAAMAAAVEEVWGPPLEGFVATRYAHGAPTKFVEVVEAGHPLPDLSGAHAAVRTLSLVRGLDRDDLVLVLLSGGGSALWNSPLPPLTLEEKRDVTRALVLSGASIRDINCVRKHLSAIKGGRLAAAAYPARVLTLAISDVVGDDASVIASGPTVADLTTRQDAREILNKYSVPVSNAVKALLDEPTCESIKPGDVRLDGSAYHIIANAADALAAACDAAQLAGFDTRVLGVNVEGDARQVGRAHAEIALHQSVSSRPLVLLSGGELTMCVTGAGRGGPNREYLVALAQGLRGADNVWALAADTDGIDGNDSVAGGWITPDTLTRAEELGIDLAVCVRNNDSGGLFAALGQEMLIGPTGTNVNDFRAIMLLSKV